MSPEEKQHLVEFLLVHNVVFALTDYELGETDLVTHGIDTGNWSPECDEAFKKVKHLLVTAPFLHPPNMEKEFFMWTDASKKGFGAVLEQE